MRRRSCQRTLLWCIYVCPRVPHWRPHVLRYSKLGTGVGALGENIGARPALSAPRVRQRSAPSSIADSSSRPTHGRRRGRSRYRRRARARVRDCDGSGQAGRQGLPARPKPAGPRHGCRAAGSRSARGSGHGTRSGCVGRERGGRGGGRRLTALGSRGHPRSGCRCAQQPPADTPVDRMHPLRAP